MATALALAKYLDVPGINLTKQKDLMFIGGIIVLPCILILASNETGSTLVFASFVIMLYREGLPSWIPAVGITAAALFVLALVFPKAVYFHRYCCVAWANHPAYAPLQPHIGQFAVNRLGWYCHDGVRNGR